MTTTMQPKKKEQQQQITWTKTTGKCITAICMQFIIVRNCKPLIIFSLTKKVFSSTTLIHA